MFSVRVLCFCSDFDEILFSRLYASIMLSSHNMQQHFVLNHREIISCSAVASGVVVVFVVEPIHIEMQSPKISITTGNCCFLFTESKQYLAVYWDGPSYFSPAFRCLMVFAFCWFIHLLYYRLIMFIYMLSHESRLTMEHSTGNN
jgi:hypothetical protein